MPTVLQRFGNWVDDHQPINKKKRAAETAIKDSEYKSNLLKQQLLDSINSEKTYQIAPEAYQLQDMLTSQAEDIEGIASMRAGMSEAPGVSIQRENIRQMMESAARDIIESGGSNASALGAIGNMRAQEMGALRDLAVQGQEYRDQAKREYLQALQTSAGMQAQGLGVMIDEKSKVFESELDKQRTLEQFMLTDLGNQYSMTESLRNREAARRAGNKQLAGDIIGEVLGDVSKLLAVGI